MGIGFHSDPDDAFYGGYHTSYGGPDPEMVKLWEALIGRDVAKRSFFAELAPPLPRLPWYSRLPWPFNRLFLLFRGVESYLDPSKRPL